MRVKMGIKMVTKKMIFSTILTSALLSNISSANVDSQMVNLNMQIKTKHKSVKTDLAMPFYQTAEIEKTIDKKNYTFEVNPKKGKNPDEIEIEVKLFNKDHSKTISKKEIVAKINKQSLISMKGITIKVTPEI